MAGASIIIYLLLGTGSQFSPVDLCSLKEPEKASLMSLRRKAQTADPPIELGGVEKTPYKTWSS